MTHKFAKTLHNGDQVQRKIDSAVLTVSSVSVRNKHVLLYCFEERGALVVLFHNEVK